MTKSISANTGALNTSDLADRGVDECIVHQPTWLDETVQYAHSLLRLQNNWNSYGAKPIDPAAVELAVCVLSDPYFHAMPKPMVVPTSRGAVQLEWQWSDTVFEVELLPSGAAEGFYRSPRIEREFAVPIAELVQTVQRLAREDEISAAVEG